MKSRDGEEQPERHYVELTPADAARLVDQDRADPHSLISDHAAVRALEMVPVSIESIAVAQDLPALVALGALRLGADLEHRQDLEPGMLDPESAQELKEPLLARCRRPADYCRYQPSN